MDDRSIPIVILCGGRGTRMGEATQLLPKPLQPIGNRPMLWHVMKIYGSQGFTNFVLATGWLGEEIKRYFLHYHALTSDFTIELGKPDRIEYLSSLDEGNWRVTCVDTGMDSMTGARVRRASAAPDRGPDHGHLRRRRSARSTSRSCSRSTATTVGSPRSRPSGRRAGSAS